MKSLIRNIFLSGIISATFLGINACEKDLNESNLYAEVLAVSTDGTSSLIDANLMSAMVETTPPDENEVAILKSIREEEKLARDVYNALYNKWGSQVFSRIAGAENNHLNAVNYLLITYGDSDTLVGEPGVFTSPDIQSLYNELVTKGSASLSEAFTTGALIEEMDIYDITKTLTEVTNENILMVFENLTRGSRNHLRAFSRQLSNLGLVYTPVYITAEEYSIILNTSTEKGKQYRMRGNGRFQPSGTCVQ